MVIRTTSSSQQVTQSSNYPAHIKWVVEGNTTKGYVDDTLARTDSVSWWGTYAPYIFKWGIWNSGTVTVTNIKVKAL